MTQTTQIDLKPHKFTIGLPIGGSLETLTSFSLIDTFRTFDALKITINYVSELYCSIVDCARNNVVHEFLRNPEHEKLICIDSDMVWKPHDLIRLCCWSTLYPIVGATYSTKVEGDQKFLADYCKDEQGRIQQNNYGLVKVSGLGFGFVIIDRIVFETMIPTTETYKDKSTGEDVYRFFKTTTDGGKFIGEDIYFLNRWCNEFNGDVWIDPDIEIGHVGRKTYYGGSPRKAMSQYNDKQLT